MTDMLTAALSYARAGLPVFPCAVGGKSPWTDNGFHDASTNERTLKEWWERHPHANIAAPTGLATFDVLDVDVRDSGNGWDALEKLREAGLVEGWLRAIRTPSGGLHLHYPGTAQRNGSLGDRHVDFRSEGGYVLLPPSLGQTKQYSRRYVLLEQQRVGTRPFDWTAARDVLTPQVARHSIAPSASSSARSIEQLVAHVRRQREGNRNNVLYWAANRAMDAGAADLKPLIEAAVSAGLPVQEAQRTVDSATRRTVQVPTMRIATTDPHPAEPRGLGR